MTVRLVRQQPHGDTVTARELLAVQDNVEHALEQLQTPIKGVQIAKSTVTKGNLAPGSVCGTVLCPSLLQGFKSTLSADVNKQLPGTNVVYGSQPVGAFGGGTGASTSKLAVAVAVAMRIHARMVLAQADTVMVPGARAQILMVDSSNAVVAAGIWASATVDSAGTPYIYAELDEVVPLAAAPTTYSFQYQGQTAAGGAVANWKLVAPALGASPPSSGSFVEGIVVPQQ